MIKSEFQQQYAFVTLVQEQLLLKDWLWGIKRSKNKNKKTSFPTKTQNKTKERVQVTLKAFFLFPHLLWVWISIE